MYHVFKSLNFIVGKLDLNVFFGGSHKKIVTDETVGVCTHVSGRPSLANESTVL